MLADLARRYLVRNLKLIAKIIEQQRQSCFMIPWASVESDSKVFDLEFRDQKVGEGQTSSGVIHADDSDCKLIGVTGVVSNFVARSFPVIENNDVSVRKLRVRR